MQRSAGTYEGHRKMLRKVVHLEPEAQLRTPETRRPDTHIQCVTVHRWGGGMRPNTL